MGNDDFDKILQALKSGQNPTASSSEPSGLTTSQRTELSGMRDVLSFGIRSVNENFGADDSDNSSENN